MSTSNPKASAETNKAERRDFLKAASAGVAALSGLATANAATTRDTAGGADNFYKSDAVVVRRVNFKNQFDIEVVGNLVRLRSMTVGSRSSAIVVGHPMGAVKEQSAMLYAQKLAEAGFITLAIDLPYWGESGGMPRNLVAPEIYTDAFSAAVDLLVEQTFIDPNRIGVLGICGGGCFAINAAKIDPRLKAVATVSMYDMGAVTRNGLGRSRSMEQRHALQAKGTSQRELEAKTGKGIFLDYLPLQLPSDADAITREFWDFYRTPRGAHVPHGMTLEQTQNRMLSSEIRFMNFYPFNDIETIAPRPMLFVAGDQAHSREFSEDAFHRAGGAKELVWVKGAGHVDLYDRVTLIPFEKLAAFFTTSLVA